MIFIYRHLILKKLRTSSKLIDLANVTYTLITHESKEVAFQRGSIVICNSPRFLVLITTRILEELSQKKTCFMLSVTEVFYFTVDFACSNSDLYGSRGKGVLEVR